MIAQLIHSLNEMVRTITGHPMSTRAQSLAEEISHAENLLDCRELRGRLIELMRSNSIRYTEGTLLQSALTDQASSLFECLLSPDVQTEDTAAGIGAFIDDTLDGLPANRLYARLGYGLASHVVIDGHNLIFRLSVLFRHLFDNGRPGSEAKGLLVERLLRAAAQAEHLRITLWFDGAEAKRETPHPRLTVRYSGGVGPNRADKEIIAYLKTNAPTSDQAVFLVTDDIDEARRIRKTATQVLQCGEFRRIVAADSGLAELHR